MFKYALLMAIAFFVASCGPDNERPQTSATSVQQSKTKNTDAQNKTVGEQTRMAFMDSRLFDESLSSTMSGKPSKIIIDAPAGFTLSKIPERFDKWLYSVKDNGGKVAAKPEFATRGLLSVVLDVIGTIAAKVDEIRLYKPSEKYDATLLYRPDGSIAKVVFDRRDNSP